MLHAAASRAIRRSHVRIGCIKRMPPSQCQIRASGWLQTLRSARARAAFELREPDIAYATPSKGLAEDPEPSTYETSSVGCIQVMPRVATRRHTGSFPETLADVDGFEETDIWWSCPGRAYSWLTGDHSPHLSTRPPPPYSRHRTRSSLLDDARQLDEKARSMR